MAWNRPKENGKGEGPSSHKRCGHRFSQLKGLVAGAIVVLGAAVVWFFLRPVQSQLQSSNPTSARRIREVSPVKVDKTSVETKAPVVNEYERKFPGEKIEKVETNKTGCVHVESVRADGSRVLHIVTPPPIFKHGTDDVILSVLNSRPEVEAPPLPDLGGLRADLEFRKSLKDEIVINPEDSDRVRAYKEIVRSARDEIKERMDAGEHFADIIYDHMKLKNENAKIRSDATKELKSIIDSGDAEGARKYYITMNAAFQQMGIAPLKVNEKSNNPIVREIQK